MTRGDYDAFAEIFAEGSRCASELCVPVTQAHARPGKPLGNAPRPPRGEFVFL